MTARIGPTQERILGILTDGGPMTVREIDEALNGTSSVRSSVGRLEAAGLIKHAGYVMMDGRSVVRWRIA